MNVNTVHGCGCELRRKHWTLKRTSMWILDNDSDVNVDVNIGVNTGRRHELGRKNPNVEKKPPT